MRISRREALLARPRVRITDPDCQADHHATRPKAERKRAHLVRRGRRAARRGLDRVDAGWSLRSAAIDLARFATMNVRHGGRGVGDRPPDDAPGSS
jgi:hypothetical protein